MPHKKANCWEFHQCGREPGGKNIKQFGVCPAAIENATDGINSGVNGGRACWAVSGTFCSGKMDGTFAKKHDNCIKCAFYNLVQKEEAQYTYTDTILTILKRKFSKKAI